MGGTKIWSIEEERKLPIYFNPWSWEQPVWKVCPGVLAHTETSQLQLGRGTLPPAYRCLHWSINTALLLFSLAWMGISSCHSSHTCQLIAACMQSLSLSPEQRYLLAFPCLIWTNWVCLQLVFRGRWNEVCWVLSILYNGGYIIYSIKS